RSDRGTPGNWLALLLEAGGVEMPHRHQLIRCAGPHTRRAGETVAMSLRAMNRRQFLLAGAAYAAQPAPLNIVVILADDLGWGDLGCYGGSIRTPNLDRLAAEGMRFTNYYSANPVCSPSRAGLLTGRYPTRAGVPRVLFPNDTTGLPESEQTIAQLLKTRGYRTMCVGKWHLGHLPPYLPTRRGFDGYFGIPYSNDMSPTPILRNEETIEEPARQETLTPRYTEEAVKFIRSTNGSPFFLYMPHTYPHIPLHASERFRGRSPQGLYGDVIEELDWSVGEVMKAAPENTLILFTSDNGPWFQGSPGRLRGRKGMTWEGGVRVPLLARLPGRIPARRVSNAVASALDIFPTIANLCGTGPSKNQVDGIDLWPILSGQKIELDREPLLYFDNVHLQCARLGRYKLHLSRYNSVTYSPAPAAGRLNLPLPAPELYDLTADPDESYNLAPEKPRTVDEIRGRVEKLMAGFPSEIRKVYGETRDSQTGRSAVGAVTRRP
ncbi:MAG: sulfatase family protein, partial [Bryobacteraceae bacterium]